ncbi:MAG TPA: deoxynucleoside kinase [Micavibrio sp.]|jgi:deoxyadenosine/deoxycytidine kinase
MRIELVGGLGIGKSTLCKALDKIGFNCIYENLNTNPFLADCFKDPANFRFPSQMWFALSKFHEIKKFERMEKINVLDQAVLNVRAYTNMLFRDEDPEALDIINQCFDHLEGKLGKPDLLINLKCSPQEQLRRIRGRNRDHEKSVQLDYISGLQQEMNILIHQARDDGYAVLDIDTESVFFPDNIEYAENLANQIANMFKLDLTAILDRPHGVQYGLPVSNLS